MLVAFIPGCILWTRGAQIAIGMLRPSTSGGSGKHAARPSAIARAVGTSDGLRERLTRFWADHFTVVSRNGVTTHLVGSYVEEAIRPHVAGRFVDMLQAVATHPMMLVYLDQASSVGPASTLGQRRGQGLNENLAREVLELHTLGVDGTYSQTDVRELAELMTGLSVNAQGAFDYRVNAAEPGAETVLGVDYDAAAEVDTVLQALEGIAVHPDTARHIATKLAVHFLADSPNPDVIAAMTAAYGDTGGDLMAVYRAMLDHPAAWDATPAKVKTPFDFVTSAARALGVSADAIADLSRRDLTQFFEAPMRIMGQAWERPTGPDGWPEDAAAWVTPQGMAGRINWAMSMPARLIPDLPDPRDFVLGALGPTRPTRWPLPPLHPKAGPRGWALSLPPPHFKGDEHGSSQISGNWCRPWVFGGGVAVDDPGGFCPSPVGKPVGGDRAARGDGRVGRGPALWRPGRRRIAPQSGSGRGGGRARP